MTEMLEQIRTNIHRLEKGEGLWFMFMVSKSTCFKLDWLENDRRFPIFFYCSLKTIFLWFSGAVRIAAISNKNVNAFKIILLSVIGIFCDRVPLYETFFFLFASLWLVAFIYEKLDMSCCCGCYIIT